MAQNKVSKRGAKRSVLEEQIESFKKIVFAFYTERGRRYLPWRKTRNPYRVLVSEVMLQQTQAERVVAYYQNFLKKFPTVRALAEAPLGEVLRAWSGLGYNRRAKLLHSAAKKITTIHRSRVPRAYEELVALPGVGDYTAKAIRVFAYNEPEVLIETNVRAVFIHHFFPRSRSVPDSKLIPLIARSVQNGQPPEVDHFDGDGYRALAVEPRHWYAALMDYGSYLKRTLPNPSRRSAHHTKQESFKGSNREIRGAILKALYDEPQTLAQLSKLSFDTERLKTQLAALAREGFVVKKARSYGLPYA